MATSGTPSRVAIPIRRTAGSVTGRLSGHGTALTRSPDIRDQRLRNAGGEHVVHLSHMVTGFLPSAACRLIGRHGAIRPLSSLPRPTSPSSSASAEGLGHGGGIRSPRTAVTVDGP
jgi:hypothetical protein